MLNYKIILVIEIADSLEIDISNKQSVNKFTSI